MLLFAFFVVVCLPFFVVACLPFFVVVVALIAVFLETASVVGVLTNQ